MANYLLKKNQNQPAICVLFTLACVIAIRLMIYQWLHSHGYFYGIPWDSFSRTLISYEWSKHPFFSLSDGYWLPLQFWLVGSIYAIVRPLFSTSEILVPVFVNNFFFLISIIVLYFLTLSLIHKPIISFITCLLAGVYAGDVFVSYTALSEPMLICFMLLASYLFYIMQVGEKEDHPRNAVIASLVVFLATATHYIGWFLAIFFCLYFLPFIFYAFLKRHYINSCYYLSAILICSVFPTIWLYNNYSLFGDPFYPLQLAKNAQAAYIGEMELLKRILVTPLGIIKDFFSISIPGLMAIGFLLYKRPKSLTYLIPGGFVFIWIWLSTAMAFSATNQEPRYLVYIGWLLIPLIAIAFYYLWSMNSFYLRIIVVITAILIVVMNFQQISSFRNAFNSAVQTVAYVAREWCEDHPGDSKIILNQDSFAETGVIPVISNCPDRMILVTNEQFPAVYADKTSSMKEIADPWLLITKNKSYARLANSQELSVKRIGVYYLIYIK